MCLRAPSRLPLENPRHSSKRHPNLLTSRTQMNTVKKDCRAIPYCSATSGQSGSPMRGSILWYLHHSEVLAHSSKDLRAPCMVCSIDMSIQISGVLEVVVGMREQEGVSHLTSDMQGYSEQHRRFSPSVQSTLRCTLSRRDSRILAMVSSWT